MARESGEGDRSRNQIRRRGPQPSRARGDRSSRAHRRTHARASARSWCDRASSPYQSLAQRSPLDHDLAGLEPRLALAHQLTVPRALAVKLTLNAPKDPEGKRDGLLEPTVFGTCAVIVGTLILGLVFDALYTMYHQSLVRALNQATGLVTFVANVAVLFHAFPAFKRRKDRCFLCIALA